MLVLPVTLYKSNDTKPVKLSAGKTKQRPKGHQPANSGEVEKTETLNAPNCPTHVVTEINVCNVKRARCCSCLISRGNWGHVSDNRKLRSQPSAGKKAPLITQTRHHGQTHGGAHSDWPWLMSYGSVFTNITNTAVTVSQCVCVCVHFCQCVFFSGSWVIRNNWRKSSINFTHPGTLCSPLTLWAPVCWAVIHSWCTVVSKYP